MTKPRGQATFEDVAMIIARDFGADEAEKIVDRGARTIRNWHDSRPCGRESCIVGQQSQLAR